MGRFQTFSYQNQYLKNQSNRKYSEQFSETKFETNQKSLIVTEIIQSCMPNQQCTRHVIDRIIDWLKAIKSYLKLFEPKGTRVKSEGCSFHEYFR